MGDINFINGVVKILETPKQKIIKNNIVVTRFRAQFPQVRKNGIVHLVVWGNLALDITTYYKINDYVLIEGYLSFKDKTKQTMNSSSKIPKKIEIAVSKIYPFLLSYDCSKIPISDS